MNSSAIILFPFRAKQTNNVFIIAVVFSCLLHTILIYLTGFISLVDPVVTDKPTVTSLVVRLTQSIQSKALPKEDVDLRTQPTNHTDTLSPPLPREKESDEHTHDDVTVTSNAQEARDVTDMPPDTPKLNIENVKQEIINSYLEHAGTDSGIAPGEPVVSHDVKIIRRSLKKATTFPDCNTAYAGLSLLAIPFLIRDAFRDDGCRWHQ